MARRQPKRGAVLPRKRQHAAKGEDVVKSGKERQAAFRERRREQGWRGTYVYLDQDAAKALDEIKEKTGETVSTIICRALLALHKEHPKK